ncbi:carboxypeptidase [Colletotrichum graminicola M1.001]|uniref:Carboxypeptidase M14B n=1 Tax=Colletotrichum graminicola (strain M1.001 / M2 / FGSC 10212) TaxID=645133 RepID=E3QT29_COLGM|nr:carboxypeptidase [Colletotrichum graminicola M1.001]EFQ34017.1 carboxypeptidase [Colletotrichum graminicola M1.001]
MRFQGATALGLLHAGLTAAKLTYASNQARVFPDSKAVAANFPEVEDVELFSPAFANPESVPSGFANGTSSPTDEATLDHFLRTLAARNEWMTYRSSDFRSEEGRLIPYVYLSTSESVPDGNGGLESRANAIAPGKVRIWMQGGVHGNEPAGDQALLALLGKLDANATWAASVLGKVDIMMLPRYNPDGVAYFQRCLATNYDPNRDHTKLARQQTRDIKRLVMGFAPHVGVDCHEYSPADPLGADGQWVEAQDGQFSAMKNSNIHQDIRSLSEAVFATAVAAAMGRRGLRWGPYATGHTGTDDVVMKETTGDAKIGDSAVALGQAVVFLTETRGIGLADQHWRRRVAAGLTMVEAIIQTAADRADEVYATVEGARAKFIAGGDDIVVTESARPTNISWQFIEAATGALVDVPVRFLNTTPVVAGLTRRRPEAYVFSRAWVDVAERLRVTGVDVRELRADFRGEVEALNVTGADAVDEGGARFEGVSRTKVTTETVRKEVRILAGGFWVGTRQKNAAHAFVTLEPEGIDSYATFNILPVSVGDEYPVYRVMA